MPFKAERIGDFYSTKYQRTSFNKPMNIISKADPKHIKPFFDRINGIDRILFLSKIQWQVLQLVLEQTVQSEDPEEGVKLALLLNPQADIKRFTFSPLHWGQATLSLLLKTSASNSSSHFEHLYSYIGIVFFLSYRFLSNPSMTAAANKGNMISWWPVRLNPFPPSKVGR